MAVTCPSLVLDYAAHVFSSECVQSNQPAIMRDFLFSKRQSMTKIQIPTTCLGGGGIDYLPIGEAINAKGEPHIQHQPCSMCEGGGMAPKWIILHEFDLPPVS